MLTKLSIQKFCQKSSTRQFPNILHHQPVGPFSINWRSESQYPSSRNRNYLKRLYIYNILKLSNAYIKRAGSCSLPSQALSFLLMKLFIEDVNTIAWDPRFEWTSIEIRLSDIYTLFWNFLIFPPISFDYFASFFFVPFHGGPHSYRLWISCEYRRIDFWAPNFHSHSTYVVSLFWGFPHTPRIEARSR